MGKVWEVIIQVSLKMKEGFWEDHFATNLRVIYYESDFRI